MPLSLRVTRKAVPDWMHGPKGMYTMDTEIQTIRRRGRGTQGDMARVAARWAERTGPLGLTGLWAKL